MRNRIGNSRLKGIEGIEKLKRVFGEVYYVIVLFIETTLSQSLMPSKKL